VEGAPRPASLYDSNNDAFQVAEHLRSRNSHRNKPHSVERPIPLLVPFWLVAAIVRLSIHLDREARLETGKAEGVEALRGLAPELEASGPLPQYIPE
jgi:hypothetical protein